MSHNILLTGVSGYLGGSLLAALPRANLPAYKNLFALVRTDSQAASVQKYGAQALRFDVKDAFAVRQALVTNEITIVFFLIDALRAETQGHFISALAEVKAKLGGKLDVHFLHTSGAKIFSSHAGAPTHEPLLDTDPELYRVQKAQKPPVALIQSAIDANNSVIEQAEAAGVKSYIFVPCIVYGKGDGFGNPISIQTVAIVKAARAARRVYAVDEGRPSWPVCHVSDNTSLYVELLRGILGGKGVGSGKEGYYLASSGGVAWEDLYQAMARRLKERGLVDEEEVVVAKGDEGVLKKMGEGMGCGPELVGLMLGGKCTFTPRHGEESLGWKPQFKPEHILETAAEEVDLILENLKD
ncbi:hypothetical protein H2200_010772 [Cladophialophora chaetospira]|uniref:NAD-dependent epimerase/dehydratase domain-containing protein n=1 Tax=Cladophialophora chaetospira TaxID=386627 RepID=A0AA39CDV0_9EURO|nr:hypothetical protein H2200_010772 [Cladophialophora chaetospira]